MNHEDLKKKAKELGINDVETPTYAQLKKMVSAKEAENKARTELEKKAEELGIDHENVSNEDLQSAIDAELQRIQQEQNDQEAEKIRQDKIAFLAEHLGIEDFENTSIEELKSAVLTRDESLVKEATANQTPVVGAEEVSASVEGKSEKTFTAQNGKEYQFSKDAPAAFRYAGALKTQKEWIEDADAMQLMVSGNLSYLILKNQ